MESSSSKARNGGASGIGTISTKPADKHGIITNNGEATTTTTTATRTTTREARQDASSSSGNNGKNNNSAAVTVSAGSAPSVKQEEDDDDDDIIMSDERDPPADTDAATTTPGKKPAPATVSASAAAAATAAATAANGGAALPPKGSKQQQQQTHLPPLQQTQQHPQQQQHQQQQQQAQRFAYPSMPPSRQAVSYPAHPGGVMPRGIVGPYGAPPPPYGYPPPTGNNNNVGPYHHPHATHHTQYCPPSHHQHQHPMHHTMYSSAAGVGPYSTSMNGHGGNNNNNSMVGNSRGGGGVVGGCHTAYYANLYPPSMTNNNAGGGVPPFSHVGMPPYPSMTMSAAANETSASSISSKGSKNSSKKRTIDGVDASSTSLPAASSGSAAAPYSFRRTDSNSSTTSTVTAGNNTSLETQMTDESPQTNKQRSGGVDRSNELPPLNMGNMGFDDHHQNHHHHLLHHDTDINSSNKNKSSSSSQRAARYSQHHRDYSADASTASSLSAGGFSLSSYERVGAMEDSMITEPKSTKKRMKGEDGGSLLVDTSLRPPSAQSDDADHTTRFDQLSIDPKAPVSTKSDSTDASRHQNLFLSLSTSPINGGSADVDATPISKNTSKKEQQQHAAAMAAVAASASQGSATKGNSASIFKKKPGSGAPKIDVSTSDVGRPSSTPTPPVHGEMGDTDMKFDDEHHSLNHHLRGQSFTPVCNLSANGDHGAADSHYNIAPQLSWSIAGDTPSLGDLAEWDEDHHSHHTAGNNSTKLKSVPPPDLKIRPSSTTSEESRSMTISPHELHLWKGEHELMDQAINGATTPLPLPAFFESRSETENKYTNYDSNAKRKNIDTMDHHHHHHHIPQPAMSSHSAGTAHITIGKLPSSSGSNNNNTNTKPVPPLVWSKPADHGQLNHHSMSSMPPTPMFASGGSYDFRDDAFARSPYGNDQRDGAFPFFHHHHPIHPSSTTHSNGRVRNLRGRMPPGAHFPPMLHIPPPLSSQLPMTSPMALPNKAGLWSPHHGGGMHPMSSPHHMASPLNSMTQSKRKCVPLKPPIPSKFQGDLDKVKGTPLPEFTSLVNFPVHMSQKQSVNLPEGMRCCVMCGQACPCSNGGKSKKKKTGGSSDERSVNGSSSNNAGLAPRSSNTSQEFLGDKSNGYAIIPTQNKGLCTLCDVNVWVVVTSGLEIKWCKGCKNFRPWAAFGDKGLATKCLRCRERQREKYALQKEAKETGVRVNTTTTIATTTTKPATGITTAAATTSKK